MIYKDNDDEEDEDDSSLPPLLKHLPKDFDDDPTNFDNDDGAENFGTMIVKSNCGRNACGQSLYSFKPLAATVASPMKARRNGPDVDDDDDEEKDEDGDGDGDGEGFGTFVVRSTVRSERERSDGEGWDVWREKEEERASWSQG
ncbi:hypothetical protein PVK06_036060 [Gossypium arboreum]|uniref:Uncharacterized protein n=1 Tax=Gossypium arboreum TaxID=29729 RepID=A0ABR0NIH4_GOSAR|nr:hypothetical protein PVK06_036060 [Gossypium arboreum]